MVSFKYVSVAVLAAAAVSASPAPQINVDGKQINYDGKHANNAIWERQVDVLSELSQDESTYPLWARDNILEKPWEIISAPLWAIGKVVEGIPKWHGGDFSLCKTFIFSWTIFCKDGNHPKAPPKDCKPGDTKGDKCKGKYEVLFKDYERVADSGVYKGKKVGAATIDNEHYLTYGLASSVDECLKACDQTKGCVFVNVYQDNAEKPSDISKLPPSAQQKFKKGNLTCALYKGCSGTEKATNYGGQQDPTYITQSSGYCKSGKC